MLKTEPEKINRKKIHFEMYSKDAEEVNLVGDFNQWEPKKHQMKKGKNGSWEKTVILPPGKYEYKFLVDGCWECDPQNDKLCLNCFGTYNNLLQVN